MNIAILNTRILSFRGKNLGIIDNGAIGITDNQISFVGTMEKFNKK
ncbi:MAG: hypothetical protein GPJ52_10395 [Candidatus Heimdallarchaeota archaeon]|nr:hypothetical protein [Candidatus Heimdallarchaeota archaeon]